MTTHLLSTRAMNILHTIRTLYRPQPQSPNQHFGLFRALHKTNLHQTMRWWALLMLSVFLAACSSVPKSGLDIDTSLTAQGKNSRVRHIVLHYTVADTPRSIKILTQQNVSSHYLITDEHPPKVYQLVDETERAWHAGVSQWYEHTDLNTSSVGIEIVNPGRLDDGRWVPYTPEQIDIVKKLVRDIAERHRVTPANIVGHSDIAPTRKIDPGPLFPWKELADEGLGRWYDESLAARYTAEFQRDALPTISTVQDWLERIGYAVPQHGQLDEETQKVISAFQMHYRPSRYDGMIDAETAGILKALVAPQPEKRH